MSRNEFLFEHDVIDVSTMISTLFKKDNENERESTPDEMPGVDFL